MVNRFPGRRQADQAVKNLLLFLCGYVLTPLVALAASPQSEVDPALSQPLFVARLASGLENAGCLSADTRQTGLSHQPLLDEVGLLVAKGMPLAQAMKKVGYHAANVVQFHDAQHVNAASFIDWIKHTQCETFRQAAYQEVGISPYGHGFALLVSTPLRLPDVSLQPQIIEAVLQHLNRVRSTPRYCGSQYFGRASLLRINKILEQVADAHATEMARLSSFSHVAADGSLPIDRALRAGYPAAAVAENIAAGQESAVALLDAFLNSAPHCANIMNADFTEVGIGLATEKSSQQGIYWVLTFGRQVSETASGPKNE